MADQIKVSTEQLAQIAQKLRALQDDIAEAEQVLNGVNSIQGGWDLIKINISIKGKNCNTSGDAVDALRQAYLQLKNGMGDTAQKTEQASRLFEDAEKDISQLLGDMNKKEGLLARDILLGQALGYKRIGKEHTPYDDIRDTNPRYKEGKEYQINCMRCAVAYELRRRGYDVEAMPYMPFYTLKTRWKEFDISSFVMLFSPEYKEYHDSELDIYNNWENYFVGMQPEKIAAATSEETKNNIIQKMKEYGDGARAEIGVYWKKGDAHMFIVENINGEIVFMCPQSGNTDFSHYISDEYIIAEKTVMYRIDNLELSEYGKKCVITSR